METSRLFLLYRVEYSEGKQQGLTGGVADVHGLARAFGVNGLLGNNECWQHGTCVGVR